MNRVCKRLCKPSIIGHYLLFFFSVNTRPQRYRLGQRIWGPAPAGVQLTHHFYSTQAEPAEEELHNIISDSETVEGQKTVYISPL